MRGCKWLKTMVVAAAMIFTMCIPSFAAITDTGYTDVDADAWYADSVVYCTEQEIMTGTGEDRFSPDMSTTRAMLASILYRLQESPTVNDEISFYDVADGAWYSNAIIWAAENHIMSGYSETQFAPNDTVTREQLASILWRSEGAPAGEEETSFADSGQIASYAKQAVFWARENGIISGKEANRFDPKGEATRAEISSMIFRWQNHKEDHSNSVNETEENQVMDERDVLIAYFSHTGNTKDVAEILADLTGGDLFEITPVEAYPADYQACLAQAQQELNDNARPAIRNTVDNMEQYDMVLLGFPIWYGDTPMIVQTFLESYDLEGKQIAPFSTSGSSGIGTAVNSIAELCPTSEVLEGLSITSADLNNANALASQWLDQIGLNERKILHENQNPQMEVSFDNTVLYGWLEDNATAQDFVSMFPTNLEFEDYNHVEKISYLSEGLQVDENRRIYQPQPGDLCYYVPWENLCFFYGEANASRDLVPIAHFTSGVEQLGLIEDRTNLRMQMAS